VALAFVNKPELIFLDEPTTGLDPQSRRDLHAEIAQMKRDGHTVLLTTHNIDEAEQLCDRIAIIDRGRIIAAGLPRDLIAESSASQSVTLRSKPAIDPAWLTDVPGIEDLMVADSVATFRTSTPASTLAAAMQTLTIRGVELLELHARKAKLEDVFLALTTEREEQ